MGDIDAALERFEEAWLSGDPPEIAPFLTGGDDDLPELLAELVMIDLEHRWRRAQDPHAPTTARYESSAASRLPVRPVIEDYSAAFSQVLDGDHQRQIELVAEEYRVRTLWGDKPVPEEYESRFPALYSDLLCRLQKVDAELAQQSPNNVHRPAPTVAGHNADTSIGPSSAADTLGQFEQFGDYEIIEELARGGMGVVYKARQRKADRVVALKMILSGQLAGEQEVQRFYAEAQAAAKLEHPNIVPIYDVGEHDGQHFFSMGFVKGKTLKDLVADGPLEPDRAARFMLVITQAVAFAHQQGVIHRDLKSANVLVDHGDNPRVTDFGLAKQLDSTSDLTATGQVMGTPSYMPPEQAAGKIDEVGPLSDVYSLGAIFYELLTGRPPFQAAAVFDVLSAVLHQEPVAPGVLNPAIHQDLETICLKCLDKDPQRRYGSAAEVAAELAKFLNHEPIRARPVSSLERGWRWCKRHRTISTLSAGLLVSLLVGIATTSYFAVQMRLRAIEADDNAEREREARHQAEREQYSALVNKARLEISTAGEPGWTWSSRQDLQKAAALDVPQDRAALRSLAVQTLMSVDVRPTVSIATETEVADICFTPDGKQLLIAEAKRGWEVRVRAHDSQTGELLRALSHGTASTNILQLLRGEKKFQEGLRAIAISPSGKWLAAGTRYGRIVIWNFAQPKATPQTIEAHDSEIYRLEFASDSTRLFSSNKPQSDSIPGVAVWHRMSESWERERYLEEVGKDFRVTPNGNRLAVMGDRYQLLDTRSWTPVEVDSGVAGGSPAFSHDGKFVACERNRLLVLQDVLTCDVVGQVRDPDFGDGYQGDTMQFLGSTYYVVASGHSHEGVRIYDPLAGRRIVNLPTRGETGPPFCVSGDGKRLAVVESRQVTLYEVRLPQQRHTPPLREPRVAGLAFSGDGQRLAILRSGTGRNSIDHTTTDVVRVLRNGAPMLERRFRVRQSHLPLTVPAHGRPGDVVLDHHGEFVAVSDPLLGLRLRNAGGELLIPEEMPGGVPPHLSYRLDDSPPDSNDGPSISRQSHILTFSPQKTNGDAYGIFVDFPQSLRGQGLRRIKLSVGPSGIVSEFAVHPDDTSFTGVATMIEGENLRRGPREGLFVAIEGDDSNRDDRRKVAFVPKSGNANGERVETYVSGPVCFSPDGGKLWAVVESDQLGCWSVGDNKLLCSYSNAGQAILTGASRIRALAVGGSIVAAACEPGNLCILDARSGKLLNRWTLNKQSINSLQLFGDDQLILFGSEEGMFGRVDVASGEVSILGESSSPIIAVDVSDAEDRMLHATSDGELAVWHLDSGETWVQSLLVPLAGATLTDAALSPSGHYLAWHVRGQSAVTLLNLRNAHDWLTKMELDAITPNKSK